MKLPFSLIQGPGSHSDLIHEYLDKNHDTFDSFNYWPKFKLTRKVNGNYRRFQNKSYDFATYLLYGLNNRIAPFQKGVQWHQEYLHAYYDSLCSHYLNEPKFLIAWVQTSLNTVQRNKRLGGKTILEHPMPHIDHWMSVNESFYRDDDIKVKPGYSHFSKGLIVKMKEEYEAADYIQIHSSFVKSTFLAAGIAESKLLICSLGINPEAFPERNKLHNRQRKFTLLFVGRLELWKGVHLLLQAVNKFSHNEIELVLAGRVMPEMEQYLHKYPKNIKVLGPVNRSELSRIYQRADALIFPSLNDAFGMVILEAMLHGLPVIGSTASASPDLIINEVNGLLMNGSSELEKTIWWAMANRDYLSEMGVRARETVYQHHTLPHYFQRLEHNLKLAKFL